MLPGTYPELKNLALWKGVLELWRMDTYIMYPYQELQDYRVLVLWLAQGKSQQTHMIPVPHSYHMLPRGASGQIASRFGEEILPFSPVWLM